MKYKIPKIGKTWRLTQASWEILDKFDTDPNVAISRMQEKIVAFELEKNKTVTTPANNWPVVSTNPLGCNFDETRLILSMRKAMEETIDEKFSQYARQ
jgi:hypothetical protein